MKQAMGKYNSMIRDYIVLFPMSCNTYQYVNEAIIIYKPLKG